MNPMIAALALTVLGATLPAEQAGRTNGEVPLQSPVFVADTIHACYVPKTGTMYRVGTAGAPAQCKQASHMPMKWDASGVSGTYTVEMTLTRQPGDSPWVNTKCPTGHALSGGHFVHFANFAPPYPDVRLLASAPSAVNRDEWGFRLANSGSQAVDITLLLVCGSR